MSITRIISYATLDSERRCDAEHIAAPILITNEYQHGRDVVEFTQYGTSRALNADGKGFPVLRLNEFESMFIQSPEKHCDLISESAFCQLRLTKGDVLVCRTNGNPHLVGKAAVVMEDVDCAYASYVFKVRPNQKISPQTLTVFLNGKYGRGEIERHQMISIQTNFSPERFKKCRIPLLSSGFQSRINALVDAAYVSLKESKALYADTEKYLLTKLEMSSLTPSSSKFSVRGLADSFRSSNRIDAEYYQQKYDDIENAIHTEFTVGSLCQIYDKAFIPHKGDYKYIELANIGAFGNVTGSTIASYSNLPSRARRLVHAGQVIVSSIEGSLSSCALIPEDYENAICSTGFYVVDSQKMNSETLLVLFKSAPMQALLKKRCSGTILAAISKDAFRNMPLPLVNDSVQERIAVRIRRSFTLRHKSDRLLDVAKRAVEISIEQDEDKATLWLKRIII